MFPKIVSLGPFLKLCPEFPFIEADIILQSDLALLLAQHFNQRILSARESCIRLTKTYFSVIE